MSYPKVLVRGLTFLIRIFLLSEKASAYAAATQFEEELFVRAAQGDTEEAEFVDRVAHSRLNVSRWSGRCHQVAG